MFLSRDGSFGGMNEGPTHVPALKIIEYRDRIPRYQFICLDEVTELLRVYYVTDPLLY